jgi:hypothetical protein
MAGNNHIGRSTKCFDPAFQGNLFAFLEKVIKEAWKKDIGKAKTHHHDRKVRCQCRKPNLFQMQGKGICWRYLQSGETNP